MNKALALLDKLNTEGRLEKKEYLFLLKNRTEEVAEAAAGLARQKRMAVYEDRIFMRGLLEFSNYCRNDCYYCGLRRSSAGLKRYRLSKEEIIACTDEGYELGFRTFVLQGGEDSYFTDEILCEIIKEIKLRHSDSAVTLSIGERSAESYEMLYKAGADRYLLRHETADKDHYRALHPENMSFDHRMECLIHLRDIGFQVGCGFMVGSPFQTEEELSKELLFLESFRPEMCGIGPFIPKKGTPFSDKPAGSAFLTCFLLSLIRLILPDVLLPATTALGTIDPKGREKGIMAGANVVMPNLSPVAVRKHYALYDDKICLGEESAQCVGCLKARIESLGYKLVVSRGDHIRFL